MKSQTNLKISNLVDVIPNRADDKFFCKLPSSTKIFCVGGAVRDALLDKKIFDRDFLLVGTDSKVLLNMGLFPIGKDFPVFLHPISKEEIALARTEKKKGLGYKGFQFDSSQSVTLEEDLKRRDFTINALALDENGKLFDFFSGIDDLKSRVFRHIGPEFTEDPLRLIRLARFLSRYPEFTVDNDTMILCKKIVVSGEIEALSKERIWVEISKGLCGNEPLRMLKFLEETDAWSNITGKRSIPDDIKNKLDSSYKLEISVFWKAALIFLNCDIANIHCAVPKEVIIYKKIIHKSDLLAKSISRLETNKDEFALAILDLIESSDLFRKPDRKKSILKIMFFQPNRCKNKEIAKYSKVFSEIFDSIINTSVSEVAKLADKENLSIKQKIRDFRSKIVLEILNKKEILN